jgi:hypothetical protein
MKTDDLIEMLGRNVEPVDHQQVVRTIVIAVAAGGATALAAMILLFGLRADLSATAGAPAFLLAKLVFTVGLASLTSAYLIKLARPGGERKTSIAAVAAPFAAVMLIGAISLVFAPTSHWDEMVMGRRWLECLLSVPFIAIVPFAVITWALRRTAPTDLVRAGAFGGLISGAISATGPTLHIRLRRSV